MSNPNLENCDAMFIFCIAKESLVFSAFSSGCGKSISKSVIAKHLISCGNTFSVNNLWSASTTRLITVNCCVWLDSPPKASGAPCQEAVTPHIAATLSRISCLTGK